MKNTITRKRWTDEEDQTLIEMRANNVQARVIGERLNRTEKAVAQRISRLRFKGVLQPKRRPASKTLQEPETLTRPNSTFIDELKQVVSKRMLDINPKEFETLQNATRILEKIL